MLRNVMPRAHFLKAQNSPVNIDESKVLFYTLCQEAR